MADFFQKLIWRIWPPSYDVYMHSRVWYKLRDRVIRRDGGKCVTCGSTSSLHVHHKTYKNFSHEKMGDLVTLCKSCHMAIHAQKRSKEHHSRSWQNLD